MASATAPLFAQQEKSAFPVELPSGPFRQCHGQSDSVSASSKDENGRPVRPRTLLSIQSPASDGQRCLYKV